tara:strand:+ start:921 stop:1157 length:237 start_codon:yes stop_codon:yes gene_type:complete
MAKRISKYVEKIAAAEKFLTDEQAKKNPDSKKIEDYTRRIRTFNTAMNATDIKNNIDDDEFPSYGFTTENKITKRNVY